MARQYYQGKFSPKNPEKYLGDATNIVFRSSWEFRVCNLLDQKPAIVKWGSEEVVINYFWETDGKMHRYFTDFVIYFRSRSGVIKKALIEVKPYAQTIPPVHKKGKKKKTILEQELTWSKNQAKWVAAREWCRVNGYDFILLTENEIFPNGKTW